MAPEIDRVKFDLLSAYKRTGAIDIASWVERFPQFREELLDFWVWIDHSEPERSEQPRLPIQRLRSVAENSLQRACLAVALGPEWLAPFVTEGEQVSIGDEAATLRAKPAPSVGKAPRPFKRAVVSAWVVRELHSIRERVSRLALQKTTYLLEGALALGLFDDHTQQPLGPYDYTSRYKDAEPIARTKGWIRIAGSEFGIGENVSEVDRFAPKYLRSVSLARTLTRMLGGLTDGELECLATVHWLINHSASELTTAASIQVILRQDPKWSPKLLRTNFDEAHITAALVRLRFLRLAR